MARVFERFYQIPGGRTSEGIGIGLALVKELVDLHHGEVHVESAEGRGTTFTVRLPTGASHLRADEMVQNSTSVGDQAVTQPEVALLESRACRRSRRRRPTQPITLKTRRPCSSSRTTAKSGRSSATTCSDTIV